MGDHSFNNPWGLGTIFEETVWSVTIDPGGQAELLGIETGDIIVARNHEVIDDHNRVNPAIGAGRIYCFDDYMLDLTTTDFTRELQTVMDARKNELEDTINELDELLRKPVNADLPAANSNYTASHKKLLNQMYVACGFAGSS